MFVFKYAIIFWSSFCSLFYFSFSFSSPSSFPCSKHSINIHVLVHIFSFFFCFSFVFLLFFLHFSAVIFFCVSVLLIFTLFETRIYMKNVFIYYEETNSKLYRILKNLILLHSNSGEGYVVNILSKEIILQIVPHSDFPKGFWGQ